MNIRVYNGPSTSKIALRVLFMRLAALGYEATPIGPQEITQPGVWLHDTDVLIFTAGTVTEYKAALGEQGLRNIDAYVRHYSGIYVGLCAGGALGVKIVDYKGAAFQKRAEALAFFNILARGSLPDLTGGRYYNGNSDSAAGIEVHYTDGKKHSSIYWGGTHFLAMEAISGLESFGRVHTDKHIYHMGVHGPVGMGHAFLLGHHPEINSGNIRLFFEAFSSGYPYDQQLLDQLATLEARHPQDGFAYLMGQVAAIRARRPRKTGPVI